MRTALCQPFSLRSHVGFLGFRSMLAHIDEKAHDERTDERRCHNRFGSPLSYYLSLPRLLIVSRIPTAASPSSKSFQKFWLRRVYELERYLPTKLLTVNKLANYRASEQLMPTCSY